MKPQLVKSPEPPDLNAILEALRQTMAPPEGGDAGFTTEEIREQTGVSIKTINKTLRRLHAEGRLVVGKQKRLSFNGRMMPFTVYRVT